VLGHFKPALTELPLSPLLKELAQALLPQMLGKKVPMRWWVELSFSRRIRPYLRMHPVVRLMTHYMGLYV